MLSTKSSEDNSKYLYKKFKNFNEKNYFFWAVFRDVNKYAPARFGTPRLCESLYNDLNALCRFNAEGLITDEMMNEVGKQVKEQLWQNLRDDVYSYYNDYFIKFVQDDECSRKQFEKDGKPEFCELWDEYVNNYNYISDCYENEY
jgi:hypothetical protein